MCYGECFDFYKAECLFCFGRFFCYGGEGKFTIEEIFRKDIKTLHSSKEEYQVQSTFFLFFVFFSLD